MTPPTHDQVVPLAEASFDDVTGFTLSGETLACTLPGGRSTGLQDPTAFAGFTRGIDGELSSVLLQKHGLHAILCIDKAHPVGAAHKAGLKDIVLESAVSTICDCEDSVAAVDAADKAKVYRNWTGLMKGTLSDTFDKGGKAVTRTLEADKVFTTPQGEPLTLRGRAMLLVRNVGIHMFTHAVTKDGAPIPEGFLDAMVTALASKHSHGAEKSNSRVGSVYIVKPKMHGPEEVSFVMDLFHRVEDALGLERHTIKALPMLSMMTCMDSAWEMRV